MSNIPRFLNYAKIEMTASLSQHTVAEDTLGKIKFGYTKEGRGLH